MSSFVSRAGEKLAYALNAFKIDVNGLTCADFGSSTGGFVDCLLQNGALRVYSVDTAYGELAWNLRNDPRVNVIEKTNAMHVKLPEKVDFLSVDVSWTKQRLIMPNVFNNLKNGGKVVSLIKPHYESPPQFLRKGKLLYEKIPEILEKVTKDIEDSGGKVINIVESPIVGGKGKNTEYLALIMKR